MPIGTNTQSRSRDVALCFGRVIFTEHDTHRADHGGGATGGAGGSGAGRGGGVVVLVIIAVAIELTIVVAMMTSVLLLAPGPDGSGVCRRV